MDGILAGRSGRVTNADNGWLTSEGLVWLEAGG